MGIDYIVNVGPYLRVKNKKVNKEKKIKSCPNSACKNHGNKYLPIKFCDKCGSLIQEIDFKEFDFQDYFDLPDNITKNFNDFGNEKTFILVLSENLLERQCYFNIKYEEFKVDLSTDMISDESKKFAFIFSEQIEFLEREFGKENVNLYYGVIGRHR